jgi:hypothetical protein
LTAFNAALYNWSVSEEQRVPTAAGRTVSLVLLEDSAKEYEILRQYAFLAGFIKSNTDEEFLNFAITCAREYLKAYDLRRRGVAV